MCWYIERVIETVYTEEHNYNNLFLSISSFWLEIQKKNVGSATVMLLGVVKLKKEDYHYERWI